MLYVKEYNSNQNLPWIYIEDAIVFSKIKY